MKPLKIVDRDLDKGWIGKMDGKGKKTQRLRHQAYIDGAGANT